jgi:hypothetical protein
MDCPWSRRRSSALRSTPPRRSQSHCPAPAALRCLRKRGPSAEVASRLERRAARPRLTDEPEPGAQWAGGEAVVPPTYAASGPAARGVARDPPEKETTSWRSAKGAGWPDPGATPPGSRATPASPRWGSRSEEVEARMGREGGHHRTNVRSRDRARREAATTPRLSPGRRKCADHRHLCLRTLLLLLADHQAVPKPRARLRSI